MLSALGLCSCTVTAKLMNACSLQICGVGAIDLSQAMFILNPGTVVPVTVDLFRPEKAGMAKFVGGGVAGAAKLGKGVGKAGLSGLALSNIVLPCLEFVTCLLLQQCMNHRTVTNTDHWM